MAGGMIIVTRGLPCISSTFHAVLACWTLHWNSVCISLLRSQIQFVENVTMPPVFALPPNAVARLEMLQQQIELSDPTSASYHELRDAPEATSAPTTDS